MNIEIAYHQGKERGLSGGTTEENPHRPLVGDRFNPLHPAWTEGLLAGLAARAAVARTE